MQKSKGQKQKPTKQPPKQLGMGQKPKGKGPGKKFLDFNTSITTSQHNSGVQQYGAGQTLNTGKGRKNFIVGGRNSPLSKREIIASVYSSVAFKTTAYTIQPAQERSFPWIFDVAKKFQKWRLVRCRYVYIPSVDQFSDAGKQGRVVLSANYDPLDPPLGSIQQAVDIAPSAAGMPAEGLELTLDPKMCTPEPLLTRAGQVPAGGTIVDYDGGTVYFSTEGFTSSDGTKIGELYVDYEFEFFNSIIPGVGSAPPAATHSSRVGSQYDVVTTIAGSFWSFIQGLNMDSILGNWNGLGVTVSAGGILNLQPGRYAISGRINVDSTNTLYIQTRFMKNSIVANESLMTFSCGTLVFGGAMWEYYVTSDVAFTLTPQVFISSGGTITPTSTQWPTFLIRTV